MLGWYEFEVFHDECELRDGRKHYRQNQGLVEVKKVKHASSVEVLARG